MTSRLRLSLDPRHPSLATRLAREPLVHFLLIGAGLFLLFGVANGPAGDTRNRIVVSPGQVEQLAANFSRTWLRPPTADELAGLVKDHVRDEVFYREAVTMGLDQNDPLIRRRMRQKLEFLLEDLSEGEPDDQVLTAFMRQHPDKFRAEPQVSFRQIYLNPDKHRDMGADAKRMLDRLTQGAAPESVGDQTMAPGEYRLATRSDIARSFGDAFALEVVGLAPGDWTGPLYSGLGGHLVLVTDRIEARLPELSEIRAQVAREYLVQRRQELKDKTYAKLLARYEVVIQPPTTAEGASGKAMAATQPWKAGR